MSTLNTKSASWWERNRHNPVQTPEGLYTCPRCQTDVPVKEIDDRTLICKPCLVFLQDPQRRIDRRLELLKAREDAQQRRKTARAKTRGDQKRKVRAKKLDTQEAKIETELASRELARRSLLHYVERFHKNYEPGWVHEDICRRLEKFVKDVEEKKSHRLMLWLPPRSGKSTLASEHFPAWVLGKHP